MDAYDGPSYRRDYYLAEDMNMLGQGQSQGWGRRTVLASLAGIMATAGSLAVLPMQVAQAENAGQTANLAIEKG